MNNDLISLSALLRKCEAEEAEIGTNWGYEGLKAAIELAPAVDVDPVRHGTWMPTAIGPYGCLCSQCHLQADNDFDYCPNCGAKMDGRTDDENHHL